MKKKSAFTMIELVFVIVVLGIIASIAMDKVDRDLKQEASSTVLSHIRLAQQLALNDNKHRIDNNDTWQRAYWQIQFIQCNNNEWSDRVGSNISLDDNKNYFKKKESAINPSDGKFLWTDDCSNLSDDESPSVALSKKFAIVSIISDCTQSIAFDYLGRPHKGGVIYTAPDFKNIMHQDCNITFYMSTYKDENNTIPDDFIITIEAGTGRSFIVGQENS